jgi:hypothetical protein
LCESIEKLLDHTQSGSKPKVKPLSLSDRFIIAGRSRKRSKTLVRFAGHSASDRLLFASAILQVGLLIGAAEKNRDVLA